MKGKPILFNGTMVRAILEGRKTQTRRIIKEKPPYFLVDEGRPIWADKYGDYHDRYSPYGIPGDRLWVRETWAQDLHGEIFYAADHLNKPSTVEKWKPSIFMPRKISRITLEIVNIRVERVQDITETDALAEGIIPSEIGITNKTCYQLLWDHINGAGDWKLNPWVFVIEFKRRKGVK